MCFLLLTNRLLLTSINALSLFPWKRTDRQTLIGFVSNWSILLFGTPLWLPRTEITDWAIFIEWDCHDINHLSVASPVIRQSTLRSNGFLQSRKCRFVKSGANVQESCLLSSVSDLPILQWPTMSNLLQPRWPCSSVVVSSRNPPPWNRLEHRSFTNRGSTRSRPLDSNVSKGKRRIAECPRLVQRSSLF